jgi:DTW domain-containing protein
MSRETCYRCFWPKPLCWCPTLQPMPTRTRFVFLMHPKEFKHEKAATGRLTHLCLPNSELHVGVSFENDSAVAALIAAPGNFPVLLYPGETARNLSRGELAPSDIGSRQLVVFLLDATWALARKMLRLSPNLQQLPRIMFTPTAPSRYLIKQQPQPGCLSTLEAVHETLLALERSQLDAYPLPEQLLSIFQKMQDYQIRCASDPTRSGYRRKPYSAPAERTPFRGSSGARRNNFLRAPSVHAPTADG